MTKADKRLNRVEPEGRFLNKEVVNIYAKRRTMAFPAGLGSWKFPTSKRLCLVAYTEKEKKTLLFCIEAAVSCGEYPRARRSKDCPRSARGWSEALELKRSLELPKEILFERIVKIRWIYDKYIKLLKQARLVWEKDWNAGTRRKISSSAAEMGNGAGTKSQRV